MKKEELTKVFAYAKLLWNNFVVPNDDENKLLQIQIWYDFLKDYDLETIFASMRELCKESDFCNIGKIAKGCQTICNLATNRTDEEDIFQEIIKAVSYYDCKENFNNLSDIAKDVVKEPSQLARWALSNVDDFSTVIASNIKRSIRNSLQKSEKIESIGKNVLEQIALKEQTNKNLLENSKKLLKNS